MKKLTTLSLVLGFLALISCRQQENQTIQNDLIDIFSNVSEDSALLFAPGIVSQGLYERDIAISPDYDEIFFGVLTGGITTIMYISKEAGKWSLPEVAPFATNSRFFFLEPALSPDGQRLFFLSTIPRAGEDTLQGWANQNIWYVDKLADGNWGEMKDLRDNINTDGGEFFPSLSNNGNLYFTWNAKDSRKSYVKKAVWNEGEFSDPELLPENVCGDGEIYNACISPDESYLIGCATGREESAGRRALYYVFFNLGDGIWSDAINLGDIVNLPNSGAMSPYISRDGKYIFFASAFVPKKKDDELLLTADKIYSHYSHPQNGLMDIYWIEAGFIEGLRPQ